MSDERQASAIDRLVGAIGFTQMQVATTCAEGHDLTPPRPLLDALDEVRRYIAALEADRARLDWLERAIPSLEFRAACDALPNKWPGTFREFVDAALSASSPLAPTQEGE